MAHRGKVNVQKQKHNWAFHGLLSCGHCGCAMIAEIKKSKYIYYHCTGKRGKCPEKWVREEEVARQFGNVIGAVKLDEDIFGWITAALKDSHEDERTYHAGQLKNLQGLYDKFQCRIETMYEDKLDGRIDPSFYDRKSTDWKREQDRILRQLDHHQTANRAYMDEGVKLLELAQRAVILYEKQPKEEKRRIINFVCKNSQWKHGEIVPNYRQPFDILVENKIECQLKTTTFSEENGRFEKCLPLLGSNQRQSD